MTMALTDERIQQEWQRWNTKSIPGGVSWAGILCFARAIAALERDSAGAGPDKCCGGHGCVFQGACLPQTGDRQQA